MSAWLSELVDRGFTCVRGLFSAEECEAVRRAAERVRTLAGHRGYEERFGNVRFFDGHDSAIGTSLRSVIWCGLLDEELERVRRDPRLLGLVTPLLGDTLRQVTNQLHYKSPGSRVSFPLHTDRSSRLRDQGDEIRALDSCFYQTGLVVEPMRLETGGLFFLPHSHRWAGEGDYAMAADGNRRPEDDFQEGMPEGCVAIEAEPGDVLVWHGDAVHGSGLSHATTSSRILYINGYVRAADCLRGYLASVSGQPVPLPPIDVPVLVYGEPRFERFQLDAARRLAHEYRAIRAAEPQ